LEGGKVSGEVRSITVISSEVDASAFREASINNVILLLIIESALDWKD